MPTLQSPRALTAFCALVGVAALAPLLLNASLLATFAAIGALAGASARYTLRKIPRGTRIAPGPCELSGAILWTIIGTRWSTGDIPTWWLPAALLFAWMAIALAAVDLRHRRLPDALTLPAYPLFAVAVTIAAVGSATPAILWNALAGGVLFTCFHAAVHHLHPDSLGAGDVKLSGTLGALLGATDLMTLPLALAIAGVTTLLLFAAAPPSLRTKWKSGVPHAPGLLAATAAFVVLHPPTP